MPDTAPPAAAPLATAPSASVSAGGLDDTMLAMDVVDTIRHADALVERELQGDDRAARLKERLRGIYATQGIAVPDRILDAGVAALDRERFTYRPTPPGWQRSLAKLWATRARWGRAFAIVTAVILVAAGGWYVGLHLPRERAAVAAASQLRALPAQISGTRDRILAITSLSDARADAQRLAGQGETAVQADDVATAQARLASLTTLYDRLAAVYEVRIVNRRGEPSGVWRIPSANSRGRNYYLIVEAIGQDGKPVRVPTTSEEDGEKATATRYGLRVTASEFERVRRDKEQDGIISDPVVGRKRAGQLVPDYTVQTTGGTILQW